MFRKGLLTAVMAVVCAMTAQAIDEYQYHRGTAVLKGKVTNRNAGEWTTVQVRTFNHFTDHETVVNIPVKEDGSYEATLTLPHSQGISVDNTSFVFLAVGDTLEMMIDASKPDLEGVTFGGHGASTNINRLWPEVGKHYFGSTQLYAGKPEKDQIPEWKKGLVKMMDTIIDDIKADRLPVPAGTGSFEKEVLGATALSQPLMEVMRLNFDNMLRFDATEYYDFLADREEWLLNKPAMLFAIESPGHLYSFTTLCMMVDVSWSASRLRMAYRISDSQGLKDYNNQFVLPRNYDATLHRQMLAEREDTLMTIADYFDMTTKATLKRFGLKKMDFMLQMALCRYVYDEDRLGEKSPDIMASYIAALIPYIQNRTVANGVLENYRAFVIKNEGRLEEEASLSPEGDAIFERIIAPYRGNGLYVHFWGMSCGPCRVIMLDEREKVEEMKDKPVRFLYIADETDRPIEMAEQWMKENDIKGEHIFVTHEEWKHLATKFQIAAIPFATAVDKDGKLTKMQELDKLLFSE